MPSAAHSNDVAPLDGAPGEWRRASRGRVAHRWAVPADPFLPRQRFARPVCGRMIRVSATEPVAWPDPAVKACPQCAGVAS